MHASVAKSFFPYEGVRLVCPLENLKFVLDEFVDFVDCSKEEGDHSCGSQVFDLFKRLSVRGAIRIVDVRSNGLVGKTVYVFCSGLDRSHFDLRCDKRLDQNALHNLGKRLVQRPYALVPHDGQGSMEIKVEWFVEIRLFDLVHSPSESNAGTRADVDAGAKPRLQVRLFDGKAKGGLGKAAQYRSLSVLCELRGFSS